MDESEEKELPGDIPVLNYAVSQAEDFRVIANFRDEIEARMAASKLESEEIRTLVNDRVVAAGLGGESAQLSVPAEDVAKAIEILKETPARTNLLGGK